MKFKLRMIAVAAAMVAMAGTSSAQVIGDFTQNGTLVVQAFNTITGAYYIRDLGFTVNSFLPTGVLASAGDPGSAAVGNQTPIGGLTLNAGNTTNFSDPTGWSTWITGQTLSNIRWNVSAVDNDGVNRIIASSTQIGQTAANGQVINYAGGTYAGSVEGYSQSAAGGTPGLSYFNPNGADNNITINWGLGAAGLASLDSTAYLFYFQQTGPSGPAAGGAFSNGNLATVSLASNGNFTYSLASAEVAAVPLPAAAWLMGAGLMSLAGAMRRRKVAQTA